MATLVLKSGRDRSVRNRHPWIFSGAVARRDPSAPGEYVDVRDDRGERLGRALVSEASQITARMVSFGDASFDDQDLLARVDDAIRWRDAHPRLQKSNGRRLIHAEGDGFPGFVVDVFADTLVFQSLFAGIDEKKSLLVDHLRSALSPSLVVERSDDDSREKEGLPRITKVWHGTEPDAPVVMEEGGLKVLVDVMKGHKTGFYLDQRESRSRIADYAEGRTMLNAFSYTGAFGHRARAAGAVSVTQLDASGDALALSQRGCEANGLDGISHDEGDAFQRLRTYRDSRKSFDLIVLDPPKFASSKSHVERAARGYKDINLLALKLLNKGGVLFTFSCSGAIDRAFFQKIVFQAASDANRDVEVLEHLSQDVDHPFRLGYPEGEYLKGLVLRGL